jgi:hypothetical protein
MFESMKEHPDLIFSDAAVQLVPVEMDIHTYLGSDVIEIIHKTDPRICNTAATVSFSTSSILVLTLLPALLQKHLF